VDCRQHPSTQIVSGVLTMTMVYAAVAPEAALRSTFGESVEGPVADVVVRNWGALIARMGAMLIYGARNPAVRSFALIVAGASKAIFGVLVLSHGSRFLGYQAGIAVMVDLLWVAVFASSAFRAASFQICSISALQFSRECFCSAG
jgi:hypothetical protein